MQLRIKVLSYKDRTPAENISVLFDKNGGTIGRSPANDLCLNDPIVSSNHASITFEENAFFITDHSTNGTFFLKNERELYNEKARLADGDELELGDYIIKVSLDEVSEQPSPVQDSNPTPDPVNKFTASEGTKERDKESFQSYSPPDPIEVEPPPVFVQDLNSDNHLDPPPVSHDPPETPAGPPELKSAIPPDFNPEDLLKPLEPSDPPEKEVETQSSFPSIPPPPPPPPKADPDYDSFLSDETIPIDDILPEPSSLHSDEQDSQLLKQDEPESDLQEKKESISSTPSEPFSIDPEIPENDKEGSAETHKTDAAKKSEETPQSEPFSMQPQAAEADLMENGGLPEFVNVKSSEETPQSEPFSMQPQAPETDLMENGGLPEVDNVRSNEEIPQSEPFSMQPQAPETGLMENGGLPEVDDVKSSEETPQSKPFSMQPKAPETGLMENGRLSEVDDVKSSGEIPSHEPLSIQPEAADADKQKSGGLPESDGFKSSEELVRTLFDGLGLLYEKEMTAQEAAEFIKMIGMVFRELTDGLRTVLRARAEIKSEIGIKATLIERQGNNPLKFSPTVEDALKLMLLNRNSGFMDAVSAVRESYEDVKNHQIAVNAGVQSTLKKLLIQLNPQGIEKKFEKTVLRKKSKCWDEYNKTYRKIVKETPEKFFDKEFARAYEDLISKIDDAKRNRQSLNTEETDHYE